MPTMSTDPTSSPLDTLTKYVADNAGKPQDDRYWAGWMAMVAKVQAEIRARPTPDDGYCSSCGRPFTDNVRSALGLPRSTPLAQRLVEVARNRIATCDWSNRGERTVAAVLRELATRHWTGAELAALADSIEKGEADG
jgi:hypothetical protein